MQIAIVTMVYNERVNLPIWIRHYTNHCLGATLFVIDHGSDDGSTQGLVGVNLVPLPRTPFDDQIRVELVSDFQRGLLRFYDVVIYTDCDEMLVADPRRHESLVSLLATTEADVIAPIGLNVQHMVGIEAPIDLNAPILGQRSYVAFGAGLCKPTIARVPLLWVPGFHWCNRLPVYHTDLYQFHLRSMDIAVFLERLRLTRSITWSERAERGWGHRQRESDDVAIRMRFEAPTERFKTHGLAPFYFAAEMSRLVGSVRLANGFYQGDYFVGPFVQVPEAFFGLI